MIKKEKILNISIGVLLVAVAILVIFKFVIEEKNDQAAFRIDDFNSLYLLDLEGNKIEFSKLIAENESTYCLIFEMTNCDSCIYDGIEDLKKIRNSGKPCFAVVVHDLVNEVAGWSAHYEFSPFFVLKKKDFYEFIQSPVLPVVVKLRGRKVKSFRYITP
jgi:hypothetical protein